MNKCSLLFYALLLGLLISTIGYGSKFCLAGRQPEDSIRKSANRETPGNDQVAQATLGELMEKLHVSFQPFWKGSDAPICAGFRLHRDRDRKGKVVLVAPDNKVVARGTTYCRFITADGRALMPNDDTIEKTAIVVLKIHSSIYILDLKSETMSFIDIALLPPE